MPKIDVILQYCLFCDYPIFRAWLKKYRSKFNKVILYPSRHHGSIDLEAFSRDQIREDWVHPVEIDYGVEDWRMAEVTPCLLRSDSEWIFFLEQDFFTRDWDRFFENMEMAMKTSDMFGLWNPTHFPYIHPSCLLIKRELLDKTRKDFSAHPEINGADHFSFITNDAMKLGAKITTLQEIGYDCTMTPEANTFHLGGLTYVYQDFKGDETTIGVRSPEAFYVYNRLLREAPVPQSPEFLDLSIKVEELLNKKGIKYNPDWEKFFRI